MAGTRGPSLQGSAVQKSWPHVFPDPESPCSRFRSQENQPGLARVPGTAWPREGATRLAFLVCGVDRKSGCWAREEGGEGRPAGRTGSTTNVLGAFTTQEDVGYAAFPSLK